VGEAREIEAPGGRLGVLMPGMGAVATTFMAGVELERFANRVAHMRGCRTWVFTRRISE